VRTGGAFRYFWPRSADVIRLEASPRFARVHPLIVRITHWVNVYAMFCLTARGTLTVVAVLDPDELLGFIVCDGQPVSL
jgi:hypothetical protein